MVKRLVYVCACLVGVAFGQTQLTITGTIQDPSGNLANSGYVEFDIIPQNSSMNYSIIGTTAIAPQKARCGISLTGTLQASVGSGACKLWGNDVITPSNTLYKVIIAPSNVITQTTQNVGFCSFTCGLDLSKLTIMAPQPVVGTIIGGSPLVTMAVVPNQDLIWSLGQPNLRYVNIWVKNLNGVSTGAGNFVTTGVATPGANDCVNWVSSGVIGDAGAPCGAGGTPVTFQTNGTNNGSQVLYNLVAGTGVTLSNTGGATTVNSTATGGPTLQTNGTNNGSQVLLNLQQGNGIVLSNSGGVTTVTSTNLGPAAGASSLPTKFWYTDANASSVTSVVAASQGCGGTQAQGPAPSATEVAGRLFTATAVANTQVLANCQMGLGANPGQGQISIGIAQRGTARLMTQVVIGLRYWVGWADTSTGNIGGAFFTTDNPGLNLCAFRHSDTTDANWKAYCGTDATHFTVVDTGIATSTTASYLFEIGFKPLGAPTEADFFLNGSQVATITTNLPASASQTEGWIWTVDNKNTATAMQLMYDWSQVIFSGGGFGSTGGAGAGGAVAFQTNGVNNTSQSILNMVNGTNVTITNPSGGNVNVAASGGAAALPAILARYDVDLGSSVPLPNSNTPIMAQAITMPASGCPCRVIAHWNLYMNTNNSGADAAYVSDGTNGFAGSLTTTTGSSAAYGFVGSGTTTVTYANSSGPTTFTLIGAGTHSGGSTCTINPTASPALAITGLPKSHMNLLVVSSN